MKRIPVRHFQDYWALWAFLTTTAVLANLTGFFVPLIIAFLIAELAGIEFTDNDEGTLTAVTSEHIPEDFTFILIALMLWRVSNWLAPEHLWTVWALGGWLVQHFIRNYARRHEL